MRTSLEEGIKLHRFAGMFPEQFLTEAGRHREAVVAADQRMVIRCFRDDLAGFVHDVSHVLPPIQRACLVDAPFWRHHEGRDRGSSVVDGVQFYEAVCWFSVRSVLVGGSQAGAGGVYLRSIASAPHTQ